MKTLVDYISENSLDLDSDVLDKFYDKLDDNLDVIVSNIVENLRGMQQNPLLALGVGANRDGTITTFNDSRGRLFSLSDEASKYGLSDRFREK